MEVTKKDFRPFGARNEVRRRALRPVPFYYAMAQKGENGLRLLYMCIGFDEEALVLFSSWRVAQKSFSSEIFGGEWYPRACSAGELISLLLGLYEGIEWILCNPLPEHLKIGGAQAHLISREHFVEQLLGSSMPVSVTQDEQ